ncbi:MAG: hypothetical protein LBS22_01855 [Puniceicoccales bacterium]|jgi:chromosome segregation ATPase|nr:hypothetical protein [Puniceicoccales bacterium]
MDSASLVPFDPSQNLSQSNPSDPTFSIRTAGEGTNASIVSLLKDIESKVTTALKFFGVDTRFFPKFVQNLRGAVRPACITAVSCFVALHLFSTIGVCFIGGTIFFINLAISRAKLEMMKEDLEAIKKNADEIEFTNQQLGTQNDELSRLNQEQKTTLDEQKETIEGAQQNLETAQHELSEAQASLAQEQRLKELQEKQSEEQTQLIAQQEAQLKAQETYIAQCQNCLVSVFTSQQDLIHNLEQSLKTQTATVQRILQNVQDIARGEQKLTDALSWAQSRIAAAQTQLATVINMSTDMTDPVKCKELIENGQFAEKARAMQQAAQEAYNIMNELNSGLTTKILDAQNAIATSRQQAEAQLKALTSQQQATSHSLAQANAQIQQKELQIKHLQTEHQRALAQMGTTNKTKIQALEASIKKEKQSLTTLTKEKGSLAKRLQAVETQLTELQGKVQSLASSNEALQTQCRRQEQTIAEQRETIDSQRQALVTAQENLNRLQTQVQSTGWLQTVATVAGTMAGTMAAGAIFHR